MAVENVTPDNSAVDGAWDLYPFAGAGPVPINRVEMARRFAALYNEVANGRVSLEVMGECREALEAELASFQWRGLMADGLFRIAPPEGDNCAVNTAGGPSETPEGSFHTGRGIVTSRVS